MADWHLVPFALADDGPPRGGPACVPLVAAAAVLNRRVSSHSRAVGTFVGLARGRGARRARTVVRRPPASSVATPPARRVVVDALGRLGPARAPSSQFSDGASFGGGGLNASSVIRRRWRSSSRRWGCRPLPAATYPNFRSRASFARRRSWHGAGLPRGRRPWRHPGSFDGVRGARAEPVAVQDILASGLTLRAGCLNSKIESSPHVPSSSLQDSANAAIP